MNNFSFDPVTGLSDTSVYPSQPSTEAAARQQFMDLFNQLKTYLNSDVKTELDGKMVKSTLGNNANGYYTKFDDGTLICYGDIPSTPVSANSEFDITITYPIPFVGVVSLQASVIPLTSWGGFASAGSSPSTSTPLTSGLVHGRNGATAQNVKGTYTATGRWK